MQFTSGRDTYEWNGKNWGVSDPHGRPRAFNKRVASNLLRFFDLKRGDFDRGTNFETLEPERIMALYGELRGAEPGYGIAAISFSPHEKWSRIPKMCPWLRSADHCFVPSNGLHKCSLEYCPILNADENRLYKVMAYGRRKNLLTEDPAKNGIKKTEIKLGGRRLQWVDEEQEGRWKLFIRDKRSKQWVEQTLGEREHNALVEMDAGFTEWRKLAINISFWAKRTGHRLERLGRKVQKSSESDEQSPSRESLEQVEDSESADVETQSTSGKEITATPAYLKGFNRFLSRVPGTAQFQHRYNGEIEAFVTPRVGIFDSLARLDDIAQETREHLKDMKDKVIYHEQRLAPVHVWTDWLLNVAIFPLVVFGFILAILAVPNLVRMWVGASYSNRDWFLSVLLFWLLIVIAWAPYFLASSIEKLSQENPVKLTEPWLDSLKVPWVLMCTVVLGCVLYLVAFTEFISLPVPVLHIIVSGIIGEMSLVTALIIGILIYAAGNTFITRYKNTQCLDALIVDGLLRAWFLVLFMDVGKASLSDKKRIMDILNDVSHTLEYQLPRRLRTAEASTDKWLRDTSGQMANSVRSINKLISMPTPRGLDRAKERLGDSFQHAIDGDWGSMPRLALVEQPAAKPTFYARGATVVRVTITGGLPLILVLGAQRLTGLSGDVSDWALIGSIVWAALNILWVVDPELRSKIGIFKDIQEIVDPRKRGTGAQ